MSQIPPWRGSPQPRVPGPTPALELAVISSLLTFHKRQPEGLRFSESISLTSRSRVERRDVSYPALATHDSGHHCPLSLKKTCFATGFAEVLGPWSTSLATRISGAHARSCQLMLSPLQTGHRSSGALT